MAAPGAIQQKPSATEAAQLRTRRQVQRDVARAYARRFRRVQLVPAGRLGEPALLESIVEKVVLQKDFLNVVGDHGSQGGGLAEIEVTRDTDGGMRLWGGGGGGNNEVLLDCKNTSGVTITRGTPVYATGSVGATSRIEVSAADASVSAKMPAIGIVTTTLAHNAQGHVAAVGVVNQLDTSAYAINQTLFVAPGGGLTNTRPTATTDLVQNIARVVRVHATTGEILVYGAGRTNDVPNYGQGKLLGRGSASGSGPAQEITLGSGLSLSGTTLSATGGGGTGNTYFPSGW